MIKTGLTSISFRNLNINEIIEQTLKAGLDAIEWGGDIHVPQGNINIAEEVRKKTEDKGLIISSYGSYYRVGTGEKKGDNFKSVLSTAKALKAPCIRVWAGVKNLDDCEISEVDDIIKDTENISKIADSEGISIAFEYHGQSLTETNKSTYIFSKLISFDNVGFYWQPPVGKDQQYYIEGLSYLLENNLLYNIHVFQWVLSEKNNIIRKPLEEGKENWKKLLSMINKNDRKKGFYDRERFALLEFIKNDDLEQLYQDSNVLKSIVNI